MRRFSRLNLLVLVVGALGLWWYRPRARDEHEWRFESVKTGTGASTVPDYLCFSPNGRFLAVSSRVPIDPRNACWSGPVPIQREVQVWNVQSRDRQAALPFTDYSGFLGTGKPALQFSAAGDSLAVNGNQGDFQWSYLTGFRTVTTRPVWQPWTMELKQDESEGVESTLTSSDVRCFGATYFRFWRFSKPDEWHGSRATIPLVTLGGGRVSFIALSKDSKLIALVTSTGTIVVFDTKTVQRRAQVNTSREIQSVAFSPDGMTLLAVGEGERKWDGELSFWDVRTGRVLEREWAAEPMRCATYSPKGDWVAAVEGESRVVVRKVVKNAVTP